MRHRLFLLLLCLSFLFGITALAEDTGRLTLMPVTETVRPGKGITLSYYALRRVWRPCSWWMPMSNRCCRWTPPMKPWRATMN